jgi:hypothetical protein
VRTLLGVLAPWLIKKTNDHPERKHQPEAAEEYKAAENAKDILGALTPSSARNDRTIFVLRYAANRAKTGTLARLDSRHALDGVRIEAASALNEVCRLLDRGHLPQDAIDEATDAVIAWLGALTP